MIRVNMSSDQSRLRSIERRFIEKFKLYNDPHFYIYLHHWSIEEYRMENTRYYNKPFIRLLPVIFRRLDPYGEIKHLKNLNNEKSIFTDCECKFCRNELQLWMARSVYNRDDGNRLADNSHNPQLKTENEDWVQIPDNLFSDDIASDTTVNKEVSKSSDSREIDREFERFMNQDNPYINSNFKQMKQDIWDDQLIDGTWQVYIDIKKINDITRTHFDSTTRFTRYQSEIESMYSEEFDKVWAFLGCFSHFNLEGETEGNEIVLYILLSLEICNYLIDENFIKKILNIVDADRKYYRNQLGLSKQICYSLDEKLKVLFNDLLDDEDTTDTSSYIIIKTVIEFLEINSNEEIYHINNYFGERDDIFAPEEITYGLFSRLRALNWNWEENIMTLNCLFERAINSFRNIGHLKNKNSILSIQDIISRGEEMIDDYRSNRRYDDFKNEEDFYRPHFLKFYRLSLVAHLLIEDNYKKIDLKAKEYQLDFIRIFHYHTTYEVFLLEQTTNFVNVITSYYSGGKSTYYQIKKYTGGRDYFREKFHFPVEYLMRGVSNQISASSEEMIGNQKYWGIKNTEVSDDKDTVEDRYNNPIFINYIEKINSEDPFFELIKSIDDLQKYISDCLDYIDKKAGNKKEKWQGMGIIKRKKDFSKRKEKKMRLYSLLGLSKNIKSESSKGGRRFEILFEHQNKNIHKLIKEIEYIPESLFRIINKNIKEISSIIKHPINFLCVIDHLLQFSRCCISSNYYDIGDEMAVIHSQIIDLSEKYDVNDYNEYSDDLEILSNYIFENEEYNREFMIGLQKIISKVWRKILSCIMHRGYSM